MAGRFNSLKGGRLIIPYIQEIKKEFTNFVFIFAGQINGLAREVIAEAKAGGLSDYLLFTDWIEPSDMRQVYASSDVVITPSVYLDVFNLTNIEAMQAQKPVVGTCFGGTAEIVVDGKTGFIVNPYDVKNFAAKIKILLSDKKLASQLGYHGSIRVKEQFTLEKQVKAYLDNYKI